MNAKSLTLLPSVPLALKVLDRLESEIANAPNFETLERIANKAAGLQREFQKVTHVAARAGTTWVKAVVRVGEELNGIEPARGTRGQFRGSTDGSGGAIIELPEVGAATYKEIGIAKKYAARAKRLAEIEAQRKFVAWWKREVRDRGQPRKESPANAGNTLSMHKAEELTGMANQRVADLGKWLRNELIIADRQ